MALQPQAQAILTGIKLLHTAVWGFFVACIVAIPVTAGMGELRWAAIFSGVVLIECAVLALNRGRCPLTDLAARYTADRVDNFDIYLPVWLARHNKTIFGTVFIAGEIYAAWRWLAP
ncbi:MAG: hypothetical protein JNL98_14910 [Bryobacterales bacterium]|nr:hypothetical protein [Bryobacterales bacterium]